MTWRTVTPFHHRNGEDGMSGGNGESGVRGEDGW